MSHPKPGQISQHIGLVWWWVLSVALVFTACTRHAYAYKSVWALHY